MSASSSRSDAGASAHGGWYRAVWRWHFYAGVIVAPLLLVLATSGLVMLMRAPIDAGLYGHLLTVAPGTGMQSPGAQLAAVRAAFPHGEPNLFVPPTGFDRASEFSIVPAHAGATGHAHGEGALSVFVDPYTGQVLGARDPARTPYGWANAIHGTLLLGDVGDALVEIAAGLAVLLIVTGSYLAGSRAAASQPTASLPPRARTRRLHAALGWCIALPLLYFLLSGLTWTGVWGGRVVQAWSTVAIERNPAVAVGTLSHGELGRAPLEEIPWALEQTPLPASGSAAGAPGPGTDPDLDDVAAFARSAGFANFRIAFPRGETGIWTISASTLAGDVDVPAEERFLHLDRHTGRVLADVRYADYSLVGRFMASGVPFHQGELGVWNVVLNALVCLAAIALAILGMVLCWQRRPDGALLAPPPRPDPRHWRGVQGGMFACALLFPLTAVAMLLVILLDRLIVVIRSRWESRGRG
jgi:uncharacterized iron-regulated membrane protein